MAPERRRASARLREPPPKRQATSKQPLSEKQAPNPPAKRLPTEPLPDPETLLPTKLVEGTPLPTLPKNHVSTRPDSQWLSIADSGVLTASLQRSRQRWVSGCFFEKYWSKSTYKKKKEGTEAEKPQTKDPRPPMTKVGTCKIVAEPHIFDVTLFVVRESNPQPLVQPERQFVQYGPVSPSIQSGGQHSPYTTPVPHATPIIKPAPIAQAPAPKSSQSTPSSTQTLKPTTTPQQANTTSQHNAGSTASSSKAPTQTQSHNVSKPTTPRPPNPPQKPVGTAATDPVIHMLAQRASRDNALKQVMKIVASGQADQKQLEYFQRHIDELTAIVKAQQEQERRKAAQPNPMQQTSSVHGVSSPSTIGKPGQHNGILQYPTQQYQSPQRFGAPLAAARPSPQMYPASNAQARPRPFVPPPLHVLLEFSISSADRFLFPKNSILEYLPNGTLLVSFLVVKKRSQLLELDNAEPKKYNKTKKNEEAQLPVDPKASIKATSKSSEKSTSKAKQEPEEEEYYQPVTIRFESPSDPGVFNVLSRVVAPVEEVRKNMISVAEKCRRADFVQLALRLPKDKLDLQT
jgi:hypothetical protein